MTWLGTAIVGALAFGLVLLAAWTLPAGALLLVGFICMVYAAYDVVLYLIRLWIVSRNPKYPERSEPQ